MYEDDDVKIVDFYGKEKGDLTQIYSVLERQRDSGTMDMLALEPVTLPVPTHEVAYDEAVPELVSLDEDETVNAMKNADSLWAQRLVCMDLSSHSWRNSRPSLE